jgi:hypothetical protein
MIALLVMTDGRDGYLKRCLEAATFTYDGDAEFWMHDDTGDDAYRARLADEYPLFTQLGEGPRRGFGGAIAHAWRRLVTDSQARFVFHLEDDFLLTRPVNLSHLAEALDARPYLTQMALRRQPWNPAERAAGGLVEQHPDDYVEVRDGEHAWLEHRRFWTTNPSLYRRSLCSRGWMDSPHSEGFFGIQLFGQDPARRSAFWGARDSGVWAEHIGHERVGTGY